MAFLTRSRDNARDVADKKANEAKAMAGKRVDNAKATAHDRADDARGWAHAKADNAKGMARDRAEEAREWAYARADDAKGLARDRAEDARDWAYAKADDAKGMAHDRAEEARDWAYAKADDAKGVAHDRADDAKGWAKAKAGDARDAASDKLKDARNAGYDRLLDLANRLPEPVSDKVGAKKKSHGHMRLFLGLGVMTLPIAYLGYKKVRDKLNMTDVAQSSSPWPLTTAGGNPDVTQETYMPSPASATVANPPDRHDPVAGTPSPTQPSVQGSNRPAASTASSSARTPSDTAPGPKVSSSAKTAAPVEPPATPPSSATPGTAYLSDHLQPSTPATPTLVIDPPPESMSYDEASLQSLAGREIVDLNGDKIGEVEGIYFRREEPKPEWAAVSTGLIEKKRVLVPLDGATIGERIEVGYTKEHVLAAPQVDDTVLDEPQEMSLYEYYSARRMLPGIEGQRSDADIALRLAGDHEAS